MRRIGVRLAALAASWMCCAHGQSTASISGTLVPELIYTPIQNASVTVLREGLPPFSQRVSVGDSGAFQISSLPAGTYKICVQASGFLDPCQWDLPTLLVTVAAGQTSGGNRLVLKIGTLTKLRLDDPSKLLQVKTKAGNDPFVLSGVWTGGSIPATASAAGIGAALTGKPQLGPAIPIPAQFHPLRMVTQDSGGANYEVLVPNDRPMNFHIQSTDLLLSDSAGAPLLNNVEQKVFQPAAPAAAPTTFSYKIVGTR